MYCIDSSKVVVNLGYSRFSLSLEAHSISLVHGLILNLLAILGRVTLRSWFPFVMGQFALLRLLAAIFMLFSITIGKNVAPRTSKGSSKGIANKAPLLHIRAHVQHEQKTASDILPAHVFYGNYQTNFSWSDKQLQGALGIRNLADGEAERNLFKRTPGGGPPGSQPGDPLWKAASCLGCLAAERGSTVTLADLTIEWLERYIMVPDSALQDTCVFYTSVRYDVTTEADKRAALKHEEHRGLSYFATDYACNNGKKTIWVSRTRKKSLKMLRLWVFTCLQNLWPGKNDITGKNDDPNQYNFWEVYVPGSWLNFLVDGKNSQFRYFENMSTAMARHCGGTVCKWRIQDASNSNPSLLPS